jgi:iduronate 2-sulfatase
VSEGGTNLSSDWNPDATGKLYAQFIKFVQATQQKITEAGGTSEIRGLLWMQGESDAGSSTEQYQTRLSGLISKTRDDLKIKDLPFLIGQVYDNGKRNTVIAAQKAVAKAIPATAFVEADGLQTFDKGTHFDAASQIELGKRFAREMLRLNPQK